EPDRAYRCQQSPPNLARELLAQRNQVDAIAAVELFVLLGQASCNYIHFGPRLRERNTGFEARNGANKAPAKLLEPGADRPRRPKLRRLPRLRILSDMPFEIWRHHANDRGFNRI